jgi:type II secretory pathway pseudopilin PulG
MKQGRKGMALMAVVVTLAVLSVMLSATTWQIVAHRRTLERRFNELQAAWLARAGIEHAAARLLADPAAAGGSLELIGDSELRVTIQRQPGKNESYLITSESRFPADAPHPVVRTETRRFRRSLESGRMTLNHENPTDENPKKEG